MDTTIASLTTYDDHFDKLLFLPLGKKNKVVRSLGHKHMRGLLQRINDCVKECIDQLSCEDKVAYEKFMDGRFPIAIDRNEQLFPFLWKPETFLWTNFSKQHGIPQKKEQFLEVDYTTLTNEQLSKILQKLFTNYVTIAYAAIGEQDSFTSKIKTHFFDDEFIQLYQKNKSVIKGMENLQKKGFLFTFKDQEKLAIWRERFEVMMRAFHALPIQTFVEQEWNGKQLTITADNQSVIVRDEMTKQLFYYNPRTNVVDLKVPYPFEKVKKRVETAIHLISELIKDNSTIINTIKDIQFTKLFVQKYEQPLREIKTLFQQISQLSLNQQTEEPFVLTMIKWMDETTIPTFSNDKIEWLSQCVIPSVKLVNDWEQFLSQLNDSLQSLPILQQQLQLQLAELTIQNQTISLGKVTITGDEIVGTLTAIKDMRNTPTRTIVSVLKGKASRIIRDLHFHTISSFGLLQQLNEAQIHALLKKLSENEFIIAKNDGFRLSAKAESFLTSES